MRTAFLTVLIWAVMCSAASAAVGLRVFAVPPEEGTGRITATCDGNPCAKPSVMTLERGGSVVGTSAPDAFGIDRMTASPKAGDTIRVKVQGTDRAVVTYPGAPTVNDPCGRVGQITFSGTLPVANPILMVAFVGEHQAPVTSSGSTYSAKAGWPIAASDLYTVNALYPTPDGQNSMILEWTQRACPAPADPGAAPVGTGGVKGSDSLGNTGKPLAGTPFAAALVPGAKCSIAAFNASSPLFRRQLKAAVTGLRKVKLGKLRKRSGVVLKNLLTCETGRVTGRIVLAGKRKLVLATGALKVASASPSSVSLRLRPTKAGRKRLARGKKLRVRATVRIVDPAGKAASFSKALSLRR